MIESDIVTKNDPGKLSSVQVDKETIYQNKRKNLGKTGQDTSAFLKFAACIVLTSSISSYVTEKL